MHFHLSFYMKANQNTPASFVADSHSCSETAPIHSCWWILRSCNRFVGIALSWLMLQDKFVNGSFRSAIYSKLMGWRKRVYLTSILIAISQPINCITHMWQSLKRSERCEKRWKREISGALDAVTCWMQIIWEELHIEAKRLQFPSMCWPGHCNALTLEESEMIFGNNIVSDRKSFKGLPVLF